MVTMKDRMELQRKNNRMIHTDWTLSSERGHLVKTVYMHKIIFGRFILVESFESFFRFQQTQTALSQTMNLQEKLIAKQTSVLRCSNKNKRKKLRSSTRPHNII